MQASNPRSTLERATAAHQAGNLAEAERLYQAVLRDDGEQRRSAVPDECRQRTARAPRRRARACGSRARRQPRHRAAAFPSGRAAGSAAPDRRGGRGLPASARHRSRPPGRAQCPWRPAELAGTRGGGPAAARARARSEARLRAGTQQPRQRAAVPWPIRRSAARVRPGTGVQPGQSGHPLQPRQRAALPQAQRGSRSRLPPGLGARIQETSGRSSTWAGRSCGRASMPPHWRRATRCSPCSPAMPRHGATGAPCSPPCIATRRPGPASTRRSRSIPIFRTPGTRAPCSTARSCSTKRP